MQPAMHLYSFVLAHWQAIMVCALLGVSVINKFVPHATASPIWKLVDRLIALAPMSGAQGWLTAKLAPYLGPVAGQVVLAIGQFLNLPFLPSVSHDEATARAQAKWAEKSPVSKAGFFTPLGMLWLIALACFAGLWITVAIGHFRIAVWLAVITTIAAGCFLYFAMRERSRQHPLLTMFVVVGLLSSTGCGWWRLHKQAIAEDLAACGDAIVGAGGAILEEHVQQALTDPNLSDIASHDALHQLAVEAEKDGAKVGLQCMSELVADLLKKHPRPTPAGPGYPPQTPAVAVAAAKKPALSPQDLLLLRRAAEWLREHPTPPTASASPPLTWVTP